MDRQTSRRAFLGLAAAGVAGAVSACSGIVRSAGPRPSAATARPWRNPVPENSLPGTSDWVIHHLGAEHEIEGYAGKASVLPGRAVPAVRVDDRARVHRRPPTGSAGTRGTARARCGSRRRSAAARSAPPRSSAATSTVETDWDPVLDVPTDDWPAGAYLLKLTADSGGQRYVPVTVRSPSCAGKVVLKTCVQTWQAYNMWGGYDLYKGPNGAYADRSLVVSLDRPYDDNGADMFLTYERNVVKLAEYLTTERGGLDLAYVTSMDIARRPAPARRGERADLARPRRVLDAAGARERHRRPRQGRQPGLLRRERAVPPHPAARRSPLGEARQVVCYKTDYRADPEYAKDPTEVTSDWRDPPELRPGVVADRHDLRGLPGGRAVRRVVGVQLGLPGDRRAGRRQLPAPGRRRVRPGRPRLPAAAPASRCSPTPR